MMPYERCRRAAYCAPTPAAARACAMARLVAALMPRSLACGR